MTPPRKSDLIIRAEDELSKMDTSAMTEEEKKKELLRIYGRLYYHEHKEANKGKRNEAYKKHRAKVKQFVQENTEVKMTMESADLFLRQTEVLTRQGKVKSKAVVMKLDAIINLLRDIKNQQVTTVS